MSGTANTEAATPSPGVAKARAKLAARLEEDNRRAAARTRNIVFAIVGLLGVSVAGFVAASRMSASGVDPAAVAQEPASAGIPAAAPPPPPASAAPPAAVAAPASAGVDVGALPLLNGTNPVPTVQPNALPVVQRGATTASAAANGAVSAAPSAAAVAKPAPSASAEAPKKEWGVIAPTVPTIERPAEAPAPAPASTPSP